MPTLSINTDAVISFTNKLEKLHRSGLPTAIRQTLNKVALDVKKDSLLKTVAGTFITRNRTFFKAFSRVQFAQGFNINTMQSKVGMITRGTQAGENMRQQEVGGKISGRTFIPINTSRVGNSADKMVRRKNRITSLNIKNRIRKGDKKGLFAEAHKQGKGKHLIYDDTAFEILKIKPGRLILKPLYSFKKNRSISVRGTGFMRESSLLSATKMENIYQNEAKKQIKRLTKK